MLYVEYNDVILISKLKNSFVKHFCKEIKLKGKPSLI